MPCPLFSFVFLFRFSWSVWILHYARSRSSHVSFREGPHPRVPLGGTAPQSKQDSWRRLAPLPAPLAVFRPLARSGCRSSLFRAESSATPATHDAETP